MKILASTYSTHSIDDGGRSFGLLAIVEPGLLANKRPQLVQVDGGAVGCVPLQVVMSHTHLTKVPRMAEQTHRKDKVNCCEFSVENSPGHKLGNLVACGSFL